MSNWCILRTSGPRTLPLARSLAEVGYVAWTPTAVIRRRVRGQRKRIEHPVPITPTFVFVEPSHLTELAELAQAPDSPHPPFSVFQWNGRIAVIEDSALEGLREEETASDARAAIGRRAEAEIARRGEKDALRRVIPRGQEITPASGPFAGMSGIVEGGDRKEAWVNFGGSLRVKIDTWLIVSDGIGIPAPCNTGVAAQAA